MLSSVATGNGDDDDDDDDNDDDDQNYDHQCCRAWHLIKIMMMIMIRIMITNAAEYGT